MIPLKQKQQKKMFPSIFFVSELYSLKFKSCILGAQAIYCCDLHQKSKGSSVLHCKQEFNLFFKEI